MVNRPILIYGPPQRPKTCKGYLVSVSDAREIEHLPELMRVATDYGETYSFAHDRPVTVLPAGLYSHPTQPSYPFLSRWRNRLV